MAVNGLVVAMLLIESIADIRTKKISVSRQIIFAVIAVVLNYIFCYQPIWSILGGVMVGAAMLLISFVTKEAIGYGDGVVFMVIGLYIGVIKNIRLLFTALVIAALFGGLLMIVKKKNLKMQLPFIPCVLAGFVFETIYEKLLGGSL